MMFPKRINKKNVIGYEKINIDIKPNKIDVPRKNIERFFAIGNKSGFSTRILLPPEKNVWVEFLSIFTSL
jgi:hypothetical protein